MAKKIVEEEEEESEVDEQSEDEEEEAPVAKKVTRPTAMQATKAVEPAKVEQPKQAIPFVVMLAQKAWPMADTFEKFEGFDRSEDGEEELISIGFKDANDRKEIVLTSRAEVWRSLCKSILGAIKSSK